MSQGPILTQASPNWSPNLSTLAYTRCSMTGPIGDTRSPCPWLCSMHRARAHLASMHLGALSSLSGSLALLPSRLCAARPRARSAMGVQRSSAPPPSYRFSEPPLHLVCLACPVYVDMSSRARCGRPPLSTHRRALGQPPLLPSAHGVGPPLAKPGRPASLHGCGSAPRDLGAPLRSPLSREHLAAEVASTVARCCSWLGRHGLPHGHHWPPTGAAGTPATPVHRLCHRRAAPRPEPGLPCSALFINERKDLGFK
jgi:hypothetical protein